MMQDNTSSNTSSSPLNQVLQKWQLQQELREAKSINALSVALEHLLNDSEEKAKEIMRVIDPLDKQEMQLQHEIEYFSREQELLNDFLDPKSNGNRNELQENYLKQLQELETILVEGYAERLKSRDYIFHEGNFVKLTPALRTQFVNDLKIQVQNKLSEYKQRFLNLLKDPVQLFKYQAELKTELQLLNDKLEALIDKKTPHGMAYLELEEKTRNARQELLKQPTAMNDLPSLCFLGQLDTIKASLKQQPKLINQPNSTGEMPLHRACEGGQTEVVQYLLAQKADPNLLDKTSKGLSAYHYACMQPNKNILEILFAHTKNQEPLIKTPFFQTQPIGFKTLGAHNRTVLHSAVYVNNIMAVEWLLKNKLVDFNAQDTFTGATALHLAAWLDYPDIVKMLLQHHANPLLRNQQGDNALVVAALYRRTGVLATFFSAGYCLTKTEISQLAQWLVHPKDDALTGPKMLVACLRAAHQLYEDQVFANILPQSSQQSALTQAGMFATSSSQTTQAVPDNSTATVTNAQQQTEPLITASLNK